ncbi:hypothetical protein BJX64DRAFT_285332 [Aspergillus heterothallicus]
MNCTFPPGPEPLAISAISLPPTPQTGCVGSNTGTSTDEIDPVLGTARLPTFSDRENLPYVDALVKEALRWHPVGPMGIPPVVKQDDVYTMMGPSATKRPHTRSSETFNPSRFLGDIPPGSAIRANSSSGSGRVPVDSNLYLAIAQTLAVFRVWRAVRSGKEVGFQARFLAAVVSHLVGLGLGRGGGG